MGFGFWVLGLGFRVYTGVCERSGVWGFGVWGFGFGVWGVGLGVSGLGFRVGKKRNKLKQTNNLNPNTPEP